MKQSGSSKKHYSASIADPIFAATAPLRHHLLENTIEVTSVSEWLQLEISGCVLQENGRG